MRWPLPRRRRSSAGVAVKDARPVFERLLEGMLSFWDERVIDTDGAFGEQHRIVTTVAALYMQTVENNARNFHIAHDYRHRQKQFTQLHLLELADRRQS